MIYQGNKYTIELDIVSDLKQWAYDILTNAHFENVTEDRALYQYCDMQLRLLEPKPRRILISKEFVVPDNCHAGYNHFKAAVEEGKNLLPFMSKSVVDASFKDKMIFDWGLYHFHLSTERDANDPRFMERSDFLLIAYVNPWHDETMHFLQIRPHETSVWTEQELIRILADNWPDVMEPYRIKGAASLSENISDEDYKKLRKSNVNTMVDLHDGRVYMGANFGLNTAGTSARAVMQHNMYTNNAVLFERTMGAAADDIGNAINKKLIEPETYFKLRMITPGDRDYLFEVEGKDFFLRFSISGKRGKIIVGDSAGEPSTAYSYGSQR
ncbi:MAG: hypothetical protein J6H31_16600 [Butyrivibrio sp.]|nr:hypothetical protein [Butyrivibrio sp.]